MTTPLGGLTSIHNGRVTNAIPLTPAPANRMFGRSGFFVHGDSNAHPGEASQGCIIMPLAIRRRMAAPSPDILRVVRGP